ncbi:hypothetical protein SAMN04488023_10789 [Pedobacter rhizosphaerae]|uniref:Uncharacterized protein n=1 Tax=Pedobacter rhizosphaerae TaxID=390241 RepID=A0A1H9N7P5_9SPHI|nr:hypothetical protein SAMN04488023_10789 [Pedobacter rhizosphaerae]
MVLGGVEVYYILLGCGCFGKYLYFSIKCKIISLTIINQIKLFVVVVIRILGNFVL